MLDIPQVPISITNTFYVFSINRAAGVYNSSEQ